MNQNRVSALLVLALLVFAQSSALFLGSANSQAGSINTFSNGSASIDISLTAGNLDTTYSVEMPRNVTFQSGQFMINAKDEVASPGQVTLDIGLDGVNEWAFDGLGFGDLGHQNKFMNNASSDLLFSNGSIQSSPFYLPHNSAVDSATMDISFTSHVPAGLIPIDDITAYEEGDLDNDSLPEIVVKANVNQQGVSSGPALASLDWTASGGLALSSWTPTCTNSVDIVVADVDGDDYDDVVSISPNDNRVCFHKTDNTTGLLGNATPISLLPYLVSAQVGDVDGDGFADILSIHQNGVVSLRTYNDRRGNFDDNTTLTVNVNGTMIPTQLIAMYADNFNGPQSNFSALVVDNSGYTSHIKWVNNGLAMDAYSFDGLESEILGADLDQDGDIDLFSSTTEGYVLGENNGTTWELTSVISSDVFVNVTIADHDGDGSLSLLSPQLVSGDGNAQTIEGNISVFDISTTSLTSTQTTLEPWSCPTDSKYVDMDNDGLLEHIVSAGEGTSFGLFVGSWNAIAMDIDLDGQDDLFAAGYAGNGLNGTAPLSITDSFGLLPTLLNSLTSGQAYTVHDYDIKMNLLTFDFSSSGTGHFSLTNMDFGYDIDFLVENNPAAVGNLTNILNQQQTAGTGVILIDLPFLSTKTGTLTLSSLNAEYTPGAPNLFLPPQPVLSVDELSSERLLFSWQNLSEFGNELINFEVFKVPQGDAFDLNTPAFFTLDNSFVDSAFAPGESYDYVVRSLHPYGVTSQLSSTLSVTIPFPSPPSPVQGLFVGDTANDDGGSLDVTWNDSTDVISEYEVFVESQEIISVQSLSSVSTVSPFTGSHTMNVTSEGNGDALLDQTDYWVAVVAYDSYGNTSSNFSLFGPVQSQNNSLRSTEITFDLVTSGSSDASSFQISALDSLHLNLTLTGAGEGIPGQDLDLHFIGPDNFDHLLSGVTDENGQWNAVDVQDLTELANSFSDFVGDVSLVVQYAGTAGTPDTQAADAATATLNGLGLLRATVVPPSASIQLSATNQYSITVSVSPELPAQSSRLANIMYDWHLTDSAGNITDSGTTEIKGGEITLEGTATSSDQLTLAPSDNQDWFSPSPDATLSFTFFDDQVDDIDNQTDNETGGETVQPPFPDAVVAGSFTCQAVTYAWADNGTDEVISCTVTNPNPFDVTLTFSWKVTPTTSLPLTFEQASLTGSSPSITIPANGSSQIEFTPVRNGPSDGLFPGIQGVGYVVHFTCLDDATNRCDSMTTNNVSIEGELQWMLSPQIEVDDSSDSEPDETKGGSGALVGGIIALLVLGGLGATFVLLRPRAEDDDWFEVFDDDDENEPTPVVKPSRSLDEMKSEESGERVDLTPPERRPSLFDEVDGRMDIEEFQDSDDYEEEVEQFEEEIEQTDEETTEDDGITVDEQGTEWWEDEEGVWWYREEGWEDWAVWED